MCELLRFWYGGSREWGIHKDVFRWFLNMLKDVWSVVMCENWVSGKLALKRINPRNMLSKTYWLISPVRYSEDVFAMWSHPAPQAANLTFSPQSPGRSVCSIPFYFYWSNGIVWNGLNPCVKRREGRCVCDSCWDWNRPNQHPTRFYCFAIGRNNEWIENRDAWLFSGMDNNHPNFTKE